MNDSPANSERSTVWIMLFLVIVLILYGSLYPFHFSATRRQLFQWDWPAGLSLIRDAVINLAIYFPAGFLAFYVWPAPMGSLSRIVASSLCLLGLSTAIEYLQAYDLPRFSSSVDILDNFLGALIGAVTGSVLRLQIPSIRWIAKRPAPFALLCLAVAAHLFPFFPRVHLVHLKAALSAFFVHPVAVHPVALQVLLAAVEWMSIRVLLVELLGRTKVTLEFACLQLIIPAGLLIVDQSPASSEMLGALLALCIGHFWYWRPERLAFVMLLDIVVRELAPFRFAGPPRAFGWFPFGGTLGMPALFLALLFGKFFLYGTAIWLFDAKGGRTWRVTVLFAGLLFVLEQMQRYLPGRTPEITDGVIALLAGLGLTMRTQNYRHSPGIPSRQYR